MSTLVPWTTDITVDAPECSSCIFNLEATDTATGFHIHGSISLNHDGSTGGYVVVSERIFAPGDIPAGTYRTATQLEGTLTTYGDALTSIMEVRTCIAGSPYEECDSSNTTVARVETLDEASAGIPLDIQAGIVYGDWFYYDGGALSLVQWMEASFSGSGTISGGFILPGSSSSWLEAEATSIPEPATIAFVVVGLAAIALTRRRRVV
jgi:hypothetical protein